MARLEDGKTARGHSEDAPNGAITQDEAQERQQRRAGLCRSTVIETAFRNFHTVPPVDAP